MSRIRVYELAKELSEGAAKVASKDIIEKAHEVGIPVENHLSQLDETDAARLKKLIKQAQSSEGGEVKRVRRSVVRRRRGGRDADAVSPPPEAAEQPAAEEAPAEEPVEEPAAADEAATPEAQAPEAEAAPEAEEPVAEEAAETATPEPTPEAEPQAQEPAPEAEEPAAAAEEAAPQAAAGDEAAPTAQEAAPEAAAADAATEEAPEAEAKAEATKEPAAEEEKKPEPLKPTRRKKKEGFKAVVVAMPEPEPEQPRPAQGRVQPSLRQIEKEERANRPRRKGKKLIYDRRREGGMRDGPVRTGKTRRKKAAKRRGADELPSVPLQQRTIQIEDTITVSDLAQQMAIKANLLMRKLMEQGLMVTVNDALDYETAAIIATDLGYEVQNTSFDVTKYLAVQEDKPEDMQTRPPVVTIMGHVDHGKTSLLDRIQTSDIAGGEAGGITQSIGAYVVQVEKGSVVFVDTPGHEAFTAMRARGALVTDIVILVVAADDGVMPQTLEAIHHAKAAQVPIIVAVNKIDKPEADPNRVRQGLAEHELVTEEWGGNTIFVDVSAKSGQGIDSLLEMLVLQSDVLELKANPAKRAMGTIIESRLEKGRGPVASVIVKEGTLKVGDVVVAGTAMGRVRALMDDRGRPVDKVTPSFPAEIIGLDKVPPASETLYVVRDEKTAKLVADYREKKEREEHLAKLKKPTFEQLFSQMGEEEAKVLKVVLKGDTQGSVDAIRQGMEGLATEQVQVEIIHEGVGVISENDVNLAVASDGVVLGFNVKADPKAKEVADAQNVRILTFSLIHELLDSTHALMEGKLEMVEEEVYLGRAEVRQVFSISRIGKIAGCMVLDGKIVRSAHVRVRRGDEILHTGRLSSLKRFKDDVREVAQGFECGMSVDNFNNIREDDIIEAFEIQKVAAKL